MTRKRKTYPLNDHLWFSAGWQARRDGVSWNHPCGCNNAAWLAGWLIANAGIKAGELR